MCFGGSSKAEQERANQQAAAERAEAERVKREEVEKRAVQKREDISEALTAKTQSKGKRGGVGRRSLMVANTSGFLGRFNQ